MTETASGRHLYGSAGAGVVFGGDAAALGLFAPARPLVGVGVYALAAGAAAVLAWSTDALPESPSGPAEATLAGLGLLCAVGFPVLVAADGLGRFEWGPFAAGVGVAAAAVFVVYGAVGLAWGVSRR